ncbi:MAG: hypothetical protein VST68_04895 [Nitrospirota bacterium]|nr:hypothetical protein [Nitrospirota bacterium]
MSLFGGPALLGAPLGTWLALEISESPFQKVLAFLMVGITLLTALAVAQLLLMTRDRLLR